MRSTRRCLLLAAFAAVLALGSCSDSTDSYPTGSIPAIENDLVADDPAVRAKAAAELADRFPDGAVAVPMLVDLLDDESPEVVAAAARALDSMSVAATPLLAGFCSDRSRFDGQAGFGPFLRGHLSSDHPLPYAWDRRAPTEGSLDDSWATSVALLASEERLTDPGFDTVAVRCLERSVGTTRPLLAAALAMQGADALILRRIDTSPNPGRTSAASMLVPLIRSDDAVQAWCGARLAKRLRDATPDLIAALGDSLSADRVVPNEWIHGLRPDRSAAAEAIGAIGPAAGSVAAQLVACSATSPIVRNGTAARCVRALVRIGREDEIRPLLLRDPPHGLFAACEAGAAGCAPSLVLDTILAGARPSPPWPEAVAGLIALGTGARPALSFVKARLRESSESDKRNEWAAAARRNEWAAAVLAIDGQDAEAIGTLVKMLEGQDLSTSHSASDDVRGAWYHLCERAAPTPEVIRCIAHHVTNAFGRECGVRALGRAGPLAGSAVPALLPLAAPIVATTLDMDDGGHRARVAVALGRIGPSAAAATPVLRTWRDRGDVITRVPAAQALRRIQAKK